MEQELYLNRTHTQWISDFAKRMQDLEYGSTDYEKCRKIYAWLCNQVRLADKIRIEEIKN